MANARNKTGAHPPNYTDITPRVADLVLSAQTQHQADTTSRPGVRYILYNAALGHLYGFYLSSYRLHSRTSTNTSTMNVDNLSKWHNVLKQHWAITDRYVRVPGTTAECGQGIWMFLEHRPTTQLQKAVSAECGGVNCIMKLCTSMLSKKK
jgi:hypothetical protein